MLTQTKVEPSIRFAQIRAATPEDLDVVVLAIMRDHRGRKNRITRTDLVYQVFGINITTKDLQNSQEDRNIRESLARLEEHYAIMSTSGLAGYWYADSMDDVDKCTAEILSRARELEKKARQLKHVAIAEFGAQMKLL